MMKHLVTAIAILCLAGPANAEDWPTLMHDNSRTGQTGGQAGQVAPIANLKLAWSRPLHASVSASPVVFDGRLFIAAEDGNIHAIDLKTRKRVWLYHTEGAIASTPAIADGRLYVLSNDGHLYALSLDGQLLWRFRTGGEGRFAAVGAFGLEASLGPVTDPWDLYQSSPLVHDGKVYFGSSDGAVYALDAVTGQKLWSFAAGDPVHSSPTYADGKILIGTWGTKLLALDAATGRKAWELQGGADRKNSIMLGIAAAPSTDDDTVYIGARDGFFYALDVHTGAIRWKYDAAGSWVISTAAVDAAHVYFGTSDTGLFIALDKHNGKEVYRLDTHVWTYASPVLMGGTVLTATMSGYLLAFDKATGAPLWHWQTPEGARDEEDLLDDAGKLRGDVLYAPGQQIQASVERVKALGAFVASPVWAGNALIAVTATGDLLVFEPN